MRNNRKISFYIAGAVLALAPAPGVFAQNYPTKPIRFLVGYTPGGAADILARAPLARASPRHGDRPW